MTLTKNYPFRSYYILWHNKNPPYCWGICRTVQSPRELLRKPGRKAVSLGLPHLVWQACCCTSFATRHSKQTIQDIVKNTAYNQAKLANATLIRPAVISQCVDSESHIVRHIMRWGWTLFAGKKRVRDLCCCDQLWDADGQLAGPLPHSSVSRPSILYISRNSNHKYTFLCHLMVFCSHLPPAVKFEILR